jgi:hypothetical protein
MLVIKFMMFVCALSMVIIFTVGRILADKKDCKK